MQITGGVLQNATDSLLDQLAPGAASRMRDLAATLMA
jgi:hypothetical protein